MSLYRPFGLIRPHGRAAALLDQKTGNQQRLIANHFGRQPQTRAPRQQSILRIALQQLRSHSRALPISRARDDRLEQSFRIPAALLEFNRQPIEQLRMRRQFALSAEIFRGLHQPGTEEHLPEAVDRHA